jgi:hypothetical protein
MFGGGFNPLRLPHQGVPTVVKPTPPAEPKPGEAKPAEKPKELPLPDKGSGPD